MHRILTNPFYRIGSLICKMCVNSATFLWASLTVITGIRTTPSQIFVNETLIAWVFLVVTVSQTTCLAMWWAPRRFGSLGYLGIMAWWLGILALSFMDWARGIPNIIGIVGLTLIFVLSAYAFISGPRKGDNGLGV